MSTMPYGDETLHSLHVRELKKVAHNSSCNYCALNSDAKTCSDTYCAGIIWVTAADFALVRMGMEPTVHPPQEIEP